MEKGDLERALALAERDLRANRLTPAWQLNLAHLCGRLGEFDRAAELVENAYEESTAVKDGNARVGWLKGTERDDWKAAHEWLLRDALLDRLSPTWKLNLAQIHARLGDWDHAASLIESTYAENAQVKDGNARVGWLKGTERDDWKAAHEWLLRDAVLDRLSPTWKLNLAQLHARLGDWDHAASLVESTYAENAQVKDGYARAGWLKGTEHDDWKAAHEWLLRDAVLDRLSPTWKLNLAQLHARLGDWDQAASLVVSTYAENAQVKDGYARVGWLKWAEHGDWKVAHDWLSRDVQLDRLSPEWKLNLAQLHARLGDWDQAASLVESTYAENTLVKDGYARVGWLKGAEQADWKTAQSLFMRDIQSERVSAAWKMRFALLRASLNQWDDAFALMETTYAECPSVKGGYTQLGWWGYLQGRSPEFFREQMERDRQLNRQNPANVELMDILMLVASRQSVANNRYQQIADRLNWLTAIGLAHWSQRNYKQAANRMGTNFDHGRMIPSSFPTYAVILNTIGQQAKAKAVVARLLEILNPAATVVVGASQGKHVRMALSELTIMIERGVGIDDLQWQLPWDAKRRLVQIEPH